MGSVYQAAPGGQPELGPPGALPKDCHGLAIFPNFLPPTPLASPGRARDNPEVARASFRWPMHCIFEVRYEMRWHSAAPDQWEPRSVRILAGVDALEAVEKARAAALQQHQLNDNGVEERCTGFRLREVVLVAEASL